MSDTRLGNAIRGMVVVVVELIALAVAAYAGFVAFVVLPPGIAGGSTGSASRFAQGVVALAVSVVTPAAGLLCGAYFWRERVWLYRAAGAIGVMVVVWFLLFLVFPR